MPRAGAPQAGNPVAREGPPPCSGHEKPMRRYQVALLGILVFLAALGRSPARADLDSYLRKPEAAYRWEKRGEEVVDGCRVYDLHLVSQVWQGITWEHRIQVFRPEKLDFPRFCAIYNTGGS